MSALILILLVLLIGVLFFKYCWDLRRQFKLTSSLPNWTYMPLLGNAYKFLGDSELCLTRVMQATKLAKDGRFRMWMGPQFLVLTSNTKDIKTITNKFIEKPLYYSFARIWLGDGLVTAPGEIWKKNIKYLSGTFTGSIVDGFLDVFNTQSQKLMNQLKREVDEPPFDALHKYFAYSTLETICQTALGVTNISGNIVTTEYYRAFSEALNLLISRGFNLLYYSETIYKLTPEYRKLKKNIDILHNVSNLVISRKRKEWNEKRKNGFEDNKESKTKMKTFLDVLLALSETEMSLTDEQIRAEVDTIMVGGQETNATALSFILLLLGSHPKAQEKLFQEINSIFGNSDRPVEKEDLSKMQYCEAVIYETLRLYPPIPAVMRHVDRDLEMENYTLPKGTMAVISIWGTGRSKRLWGDSAEEFYPERWINNEVPAAAAFTPFSYGRRACIGKKYAMTSLKTILSWCIRELEFKSDIRNLRLKCDIALRAIRGHLIEVKLRKKIQ